jgi:CHAD domain-containing protein
VTVTAEFASSQIDRLLRKLTAQIRKTLQLPDADAVHDLRVSIRRFDQALLVFAELLEKKHVRKTRRRLKEIMALAGAVRNCDIADKLIGARFSEARKEIDSRREGGRQSLADVLRRWIDERYSSNLSDWLQVTGAEGVEQVKLHRATRNFSRLGGNAVESQSPTALHRFRIAAKHYRYTLELLAPIIGRRRAARHLSMMKEVQSRLGNVNDCETVRVLAADWNLGKDVNRFLRMKERRQMEKFRDLWNAQFADPKQARRWTEDLRGTPRKPVREK